MMQMEQTECGLAALAMIASYHGHRLNLADLRQRFPISRKGMTLQNMLRVAVALKLECRPLRLEMEHVRQLALPCVLHWDRNHFVVLASVCARTLTIHDPAVGIRTFGWREFGKHFTGIAVELAPATDFVAARQAARIGITGLMGRIVGLKRGLFHILALALALECLSVAMPFYLQWVVDRALAFSDHNLITVLGIGFILLTALHACVAMLRGWLVATLSAHVDFQWLRNVFSHLLKLPIEYFEKRQLGAISSCFHSMEVIQNTLTVGFTQAVVDGMLILGTLTMMSIYSPLLTAIACFAVGLYGIVRWAMFPALRNAMAEHIVSDGKQHSHFLETVRGVQSVRLFGREAERKLGWLNMLADRCNASLRVQRMAVVQQAATLLLLGIERVIVIWLAALAVLRHEFTIGTLFAFLAYREQFSSRIMSLTDKLFDWRMLGLHAERIADIVRHPPEQSDPRDEIDLSGIEPSITLDNVGYRYSPTEPEVLTGISLRIDAGDCVVITGASGCGKTTLAKILLGLFEPSMGEVRVGGHVLGELGITNYRQMVGTVTQDDILFIGSIADNICFFDPLRNQAWIEECARLASIHADISAMPMGYNTLIGDIGTGLSGGQKQRILLARALYKRPSVLVLDEATSHLDVLNERTVNAAIRGMNLTRIVIAHRPETIGMANRVIVMEAGRIAQDVAMTPDGESYSTSGDPAFPTQISTQTQEVSS
ncbi:peptidase domain-containing ABC transporter [Ralstonia syzygii]|uniref:Cyclolysin secretion/processing ATP-binding protein CyaB n=2 Tax=Ralstonia syzygii TaxID=28097 RepID=G3A9T8_9RALS|nr:peptidase domain-containing ABC transporter [Ralstonia syzygii]CCA88058.1 putative colicin V secretion atp-binding protein [Ralstonia syzygii R24]